MKHPLNKTVKSLYFNYKHNLVTITSSFQLAKVILLRQYGRRFLGHNGNVLSTFFNNTGRKTMNFKSIFMTLGCALALTMNAGSANASKRLIGDDL
ncbi:MAG: hypothetical protein ACI8WB_005919, partial [Phenylobacterium sp.]